MRREIFSCTRRSFRDESGPRAGCGARTLELMIKLIQKLLGGSRNDREIKRLWPLVREINQIAETYQSFSDDELRGKTQEFKQRIRDAVAEIEAEQAETAERLRSTYAEPHVGGDGEASELRDLSLAERQDLYDRLDHLETEWAETIEEVLEEILPEAFAVIKETCRRFLGKEWQAGGTTILWEMVPYDVQLIGGIVLHRGNIAEMKTGEGKTLVAVAPVYLNALVGRGVHLVTVNPYLAQRDSEWMGPLFAFHGLTVECIDRHEPHSRQRREAYQADITYGTNNEFGFDYLRDNSFVIDPNQLVQRGHHFAIVDEVDSVLVDEARTPLIISGPVPHADEGAFAELKPNVEQVVRAQQRLVAQLVTEAETLLAQRDAAAESDRKAAAELEEKAGLALLRAHRGFPKNPKFIKLKNEPGVGALLQKTEYYYLQDNARNMPFVDEELYFAFDEKQRSIEMTGKGQEYIGKTAGQDASFFVIPDLGEEVAKLEHWQRDELANLESSLAADETLSDEKREHKLEHEQRVLHNQLDEKKRALYALYSERSTRIHSVNQLLKAYVLFEKDVEYIVEEGRVKIVDEHTGRVMHGRRYSDGLHEAIEAKEGVKVERATQTYATITLQNYFRMYTKLSGMTGTAETEASEFFQIYKLDVFVIPTHKPIVRNDEEDLLYRSRREKYTAVMDKIHEYHERGQPVLVGTTSVDVSETISRMLKRQNIPHNVLNARADRQKTEAMIVAEAGQRGAVTIATNMAGRGTDIKLGPGVRELGGLAILGTERHESRRIDLQLRGRSGRQGDPGESQFYVSLEDELMRLFGQDRTARIMDRLGLKEGEVITHSMVTKSIERAQKRVEQNNFAIRKRQLEFDDVLNAQREVIYDRRMHALKGERLRGDILDMLRTYVESLVSRHYDEGDLEGLRSELLRQLAFDFEIDRELFLKLGDDGLVDRIYDAAVETYSTKRRSLARPFFAAVQRLVESDLEEKPERLYVDFTDGRRLLRATVRVEDALKTEGMEIGDALERVAVLATIDERWTEHLRELDDLKEGIGLRAYGQKDPLLEYKMDAFNQFQQLLEQVNQEVTSLVFKAGPLVDGQRATADRPPVRGRQQARMDAARAQATKESVANFSVTSRGGEDGGRRDPTTKQQPIINADTVGRNDPCPCGSGKKFKHCHGRV